MESRNKIQYGEFTVHNPDWVDDKSIVANPDKDKNKQCTIKLFFEESQLVKGGTGPIHKFSMLKYIAEAIFSFKIPASDDTVYFLYSGGLNDLRVYYFPADSNSIEIPEHYLKIKPAETEAEKQAREALINKYKDNTIQSFKNMPTPPLVNKIIEMKDRNMLRELKASILQVVAKIQIRNVEEIFEPNEKLKFNYASFTADSSKEPIITAKEALDEISLTEIIAIIVKSKHKDKMYEELKKRNFGSYGVYEEFGLQFSTYMMNVDQSVQAERAKIANEEARAKAEETQRMLAAAKKRLITSLGHFEAQEVRVVRKKKNSKRSSASVSPEDSSLVDVKQNIEIYIRQYYEEKIKEIEALENVTPQEVEKYSLVQSRIKKAKELMALLKSNPSCNELHAGINAYIKKKVVLLFGESIIDDEAINKIVDLTNAVLENVGRFAALLIPNPGDDVISLGVNFYIQEQAKLIIENETCEAVDVAELEAIKTAAENLKKKPAYSFTNKTYSVAQAYFKKRMDAHVCELLSEENPKEALQRLTRKKIKHDIIEYIDLRLQKFQVENREPEVGSKKAYQILDSIPFMSFIEATDNNVSLKKDIEKLIFENNLADLRLVLKGEEYRLFKANLEKAEKQGQYSPRDFFSGIEERIVKFDMGISRTECFANFDFQKAISDIKHAVSLGAHFFNNKKAFIEQLELLTIKIRENSLSVKQYFASKFPIEKHDRFDQVDPTNIVNNINELILMLRISNDMDALKREIHAIQLKISDYKKNQKKWLNDNLREISENESKSNSQLPDVICDLNLPRFDETMFSAFSAELASGQVVEEFNQQFQLFENETKEYQASRSHFWADNDYEALYSNELKVLAFSDSVDFIRNVDLMHAPAVIETGSSHLLSAEQSLEPTVTSTRSAPRNSHGTQSASISISSSAPKSRRTSGPSLAVAPRYEESHVTPFDLDGFVVPHTSTEEENKEFEKLSRDIEAAEQEKAEHDAKDEQKPVLELNTPVRFLKLQCEARKKILEATVEQYKKSKEAVIILNQKRTAIVASLKELKTKLENQLEEINRKLAVITYPVVVNDHETVFKSMSEAKELAEINIKLATDNLSLFAVSFKKLSNKEYLSSDEIDQHVEEANRISETVQAHFSKANVSELVRLTALANQRVQVREQCLLGITELSNKLDGLMTSLKENGEDQGAIAESLDKFPVYLQDLFKDKKEKYLKDIADFDSKLAALRKALGAARIAIQNQDGKKELSTDDIEKKYKDLAEEVEGLINSAAARHNLWLETCKDLNAKFLAYKKFNDERATELTTINENLNNSKAVQDSFNGILDGNVSVDFDGAPLTKFHYDVLKPLYDQARKKFDELQKECEECETLFDKLATAHVDNAVDQIELKERIETLSEQVDGLQTNIQDRLNNSASIEHFKSDDALYSLDAVLIAERRDNIIAAKALYADLTDGHLNCICAADLSVGTQITNAKKAYESLPKEASEIDKAKAKASVLFLTTVGEAVQTCTGSDVSDSRKSSPQGVGAACLQALKKGFSDDTEASEELSILNSDGGDDRQPPKPPGPNRYLNYPGKVLKSIALPPPPPKSFFERNGGYITGLASVFGGLGLVAGGILLLPFTGLIGGLVIMGVGVAAMVAGSGMIGANIAADYDDYVVMKEQQQRLQSQSQPRSENGVDTKSITRKLASQRISVPPATPDVSPRQQRSLSGSSANLRQFGGGKGKRPKDESSPSSSPSNSR